VIEYNRAELPVKKDEVLVWLNREIQQWVWSDGHLSYHVPANEALYSIQAQSPQIDWRTGILRVDQAYVIEPNDGRNGEAHFLPLFEFEAISLPNGLERIIARCLTLESTIPTGKWLTKCLDTLWAELLRVCSPPKAQPDTIRSVLEDSKKSTWPLGLILFKAARDVVACAGESGIMPPVETLSPNDRGSWIIMGYTLFLVSKYPDEKEFKKHFDGGLFNDVVPQAAADFLRHFPTLQAAVKKFDKPINMSGTSPDTLAAVEQLLNLTPDEARLLVSAKPLVMQFKESLLSQSAQPPQISAGDADEIELSEVEKRVKAKWGKVTPKRLEVMTETIKAERLEAQGLSDAIIAERLDIDLDTVRRRLGKKK
jgi:hypothetical protein